MGAKKKRGCFHWCWVGVCSVAGALLGAGLLGLKFQSWPLAITGAVVGGGLGFGFGKLVPFGDFLMHAGD